MILLKRISLSLMGLFCFFMINSVYADPYATNNNNNNSGQGQQTSACPPANQNDIYDPRVPPAGTYKIKHADGSSETLYTTGEKKPYITDNNCNNGGAVIQPYISPNQPQPGPPVPQPRSR